MTGHRLPGPKRIPGTSISARGSLPVAGCSAHWQLRHVGLVPLALFGLGVGGAWIGYLTRLAPYQPYFLGIASVCLGLGFWLRRRSRRMACAQDEMCTHPLPSRIVMTGLVVAGVLIVAVLALDLLAPLFL